MLLAGACLPARLIGMATSKPPKAPSRAQPKREGKDVVYDFGDKITESDVKRSRTVFFETSKVYAAPADQEARIARGSSP